MFLLNVLLLAGTIAMLPWGTAIASIDLDVQLKVGHELREAFGRPVLEEMPTDLADLTREIGVVLHVIKGGRVDDLRELRGKL